MSDQIENTIKMRLFLSFLGGVSGFLIWFFADVLGDNVQNKHLIMFAISVTGSFAGVMLISVGPLGIRRALRVAVIVSLPASLLLLWAGFRFAELGAFFNSGQPVLAFGVIVSVPLPFLIAVYSERKIWNDFEVLFDQAWDIVVRYGAAWIFVGVFWGVVFLSDALLRIVGIDIIKQLLRIDGVPPVLTGLALGMAIAVVDELSDYISPFLVLRLLRLLIPLVLIVVLVFLVAVPIKGLSGLFTGLSAASILMAITAGAVTLITTGLGQNKDCAVTSPIMVVSARILSVLVMILAGLAAYAVWVRIAQYGLTPARILAALIAALGVAYGVVYGVLALLGGDWMARIRTGNVYLAIALVVISALWLTPLLNPQRLSANNQVARFEAGKTAIDALDLWALDHEWGVAGQAAMQRIKVLGQQEEFAGLQERLAKLEQTQSRYDFNRDQTAAVQVQNQTQQIEAIVNTIPVRGMGQTVVPKDVIKQAIQGLSRFSLNDLYRNCDEASTAVCVLVFMEDVKATPHPYAIVFWQGWRDGITPRGLRFINGKYVEVGTNSLLNGVADAASIQDILENKFEIVPVTVLGLRVKDQVLFIQPSPFWSLLRPELLFLDGK